MTFFPSKRWVFIIDSVHLVLNDGKKTGHPVRNSNEKTLNQTDISLFLFIAAGLQDTQVVDESRFLKM